ncbi:hypothetical protein BGZ90_011104 [Linnemannia elongata]|nr:hypothetical protein BGZ90_011104 [Linnemannia elongata]
MNNEQKSLEPRPALETEDIKSQLNAIVAPYGILFSEAMEEEESPLPLDLTHPFSLGTATEQSIDGQTLTAASSFSPGESLKTVPRQPTISAVDGKSLGIQSAQGSLVESTAEKTFGEGRWSSLDGSSPESRGGSQSNKGRVSKPGSKLAKGWKKFRQSLKAGNTLSHGPGGIPPLFGSHSSVAEDATRSDDSPALSSVEEQRKTLSDLDRPFEMGSEDNLLDFGPGFGTGLTHKFSSGSLKGLLLKGSSISSAKDFDVDLLPPIRSRATLESHDKLAGGGIGAVVVDTESVMSLGKMRQYGKEDWIAQQQQRLIQHSRSSSKHHPSGPLGVADSSTSGDVVVPISKENAAVDGTGEVEANGIIPTPGAEVARDGVENLITSSSNADSEEDTSIPVVSVIEPTDNVIVMEPKDEGPVVMAGIDMEDTPTVVPRDNRLGQDLATPQQWRLSTHGTPKVVGSIGERRVSVVCDNEVYLQRLMQDSVAPEQDPSESDQPEENEEDRMDNAFKVPLYQSVQLASAMFDNGQRIPLVLYYVTEELRARVSQRDAIKTIDSLFPVDWEESDEEFEKLVDVFDQRPFGQFFDLSLEPSAIQPPSDITNQVHPFEAPAPESDTTEDANTEQTESNDDTPTAPVEPSQPRVSSRDLSRLILRFLKDLPEPLIPADVFSTFSAMTKLQTLDSVKIQASSLLVQLLSTEHRELLQFLLEFLDEVVLRSLRDELERLEHSDSPQPLEHEPTLPELGDKYKDTLDRLSNILGVVFSHATIRSEYGAGAGAEKQRSQTSLYRHYKRDFELKALQEQNAQAIRNSAAVFQSLLTFRTTIFGSSYFSIGQENNGEYGSDRSHARGGGVVDHDDQSSVDESVCGMDSDYEYQSDSALYEVATKRPLGRRNIGFKSPDSPKRPLTKSKTLHSRHRHHHCQLRRGRKQRKSGFSFAVSSAEGEGADDQAGVQKKSSTDTLCDSAVDMTTNVDVVALAAMQEHMARSMRNQKHLPRPSVATLHSILAEAHSVMGEVGVDRATAAAAVAAAGTGVGAGARITAADEDVMKDDAASMAGDAAMTEYGEAVTADRSGRRRTGKGEGEADDEGEGETYDRELGFGHAAKTKLKYGFTDFLQEPLDRKQEEREIQLVEKEILRSEITTKFLAANLAGLYPSSSQTAIPSVILPSARSTLLPQTSSRSSTDVLAVPQTSNESSTAVGTPALSRELTLEPQEQIQLPDDHRATDDCSCSYCTTLVQPSQIPVLTRDEYEKAELQSQCDAKDQHIAELLKTVQSLQGEVNILNAKLLFLHDHHTTRPMRRRTLARNSFPAVPSSNTSREDWSSRQQHHSSQQLSDPPSSAPQMGQISSFSPPSSTTAAAPGGGNGYNSPQGSPKLFSEGIHMSNNADSQMSRGKSRHMSLGWEYGHSGGGQDLSTLEEDEAMSFLDLDDPQRPPPPPFPTSNSAQRPGRPGIGLGEVVEEEEEDHEPEREGEDLLDEFYYMDAYKTMDQQLYRRPILPIAAPPRPMSTDQYKKHHRMSLPIQNLSKRLSLGQTFRWKGRAAAA